MIAHGPILSLLIAATIVLAGACGYGPAPVGNPLHAQSPTPEDARTLCNRIRDIQVFPMKGESGLDSTYDAFMAQGEAVVPCLIEEVTDTSTIPDPRQEPRFPGVETTIGDIAYFLIVDITKLSFTELLPSDVQKRYKTEGVYAYFKFVEKPSNRMKLRDSLRTWYRRRTKPQ